ncbi:MULTISPECIES: NrsF family protein [unclassified Sinorhizobium]|uniref:NrsF family protein n=1 Tax=unclassified Sinorhizobium TaxID=2613772 RepID=UPI0024C37A54|nr:MULTISPECIES: NrsF family protein [unclassified Sinorhizobium]MDK1378390.1 NrsF family protein [Sinorhizobium sp. 6-70]MDK1482630.1 NrsF family protein [Sinorhizobium sp. 6-117]MDK1482641.1 NrsF family protein [Sinorhizobium sp. 6-117]
METHELIKALAADSRRTGVPMNTVWWGAVLIAIAIATTVFFALLGPRPDIASAAQTVRFLFKFLVTIALGASAFALLRMLSRPEADARGVLPCLAIAPALILAGVAIELIVSPAETWPARLVGTNSLVCLTFIPLIGIGPLALLLLALRHGAASHPTLAGAIAGLLAGGIAATLYASHCPDDSPLFVATWYTIAVAGLALLGTLGGRYVARW